MRYFESTEELDEYIESMLKTNAIYNRVYNESLGMDEYEATINLRSIKKSRINEDDYDYLFKYLKQKGIKVVGTAYALCGYFDNYRYYEKKPNLVFAGDCKFSQDDIDSNMKKLSKMPCGEERTKLRDALIRNNMPYVKYIARKYKNLDLEFDELLNYGYIGLINAIDNYDACFDTKFSSYAYKYIKHSILKGIANLNNFTDSRLYFEMVNKYKELEQTDIEYDDCFFKTLELMSNEKKNTDFVSKYYSLNPVLFEECGDIESSFDMEEEITDAMYQDVIKDVVVSELEKYDKNNIVGMYFGIGQDEKKEKEIATFFGVSKQCINERKHNVLKKLKKSDRLNKLYNEEI